MKNQKLGLQVKKDLVSVISATLLALERRHHIKLDEISNRIIHNATIYQNEEVISLAIVIYSLSKISERNELHPLPNWPKFLEKIEFDLTEARQNLNRDKLSAYMRNIANLVSLISSVDNKIKLYVVRVLEKAKLKKGSKIYEHGISIQRISELLDINLWELSNYVGHTQIIDEEEIKFDAKSRLELVKKIFGV
ncbi:hypothetical protein KY325_03330 [Candidatus Woesearchaeota archaeon]|nr:hypothetical protein [Candidatus Woesearchaeota archaeon]MBW3018165.1 hypothetical protein [Candidatus Woesearchaeota archaeon]